MKPARVTSPYIKILPWYYSDRRQPSRFSEMKKALEKEQAAEGDSTDILLEENLDC